MCRFKKLLVGLLASTVLLCSCSEKKDYSEFENSVNAFCDKIAELDNSMNCIIATADDAKKQLLGFLDELDNQFSSFSILDFPEEFDYLESVADEAADYMKEAVSYYHKTYEPDLGIDDESIQYAEQYYERAYKRIKLIISVLQGNEPDNVVAESNDSLQEQE